MVTPLTGGGGCSWVAYQTGGCWPHGQPTAQYNEWSGFLSIVIPLLVQLLAVGALWWWHHQCSVHHCYWPARRMTAANERACWLHHPAPRMSVEDIHASHFAALRHLHHPAPPGGSPHDHIDPIS